MYAQPVQQDTRLNVGLGFFVQHQLSYYDSDQVVRQLTFSFPTARLRVHSVWEDRVSLFLQADLLQSPSILDAQLTVPLLERLELDVGLFKSPFSREFLLFPEDLPFEQRSMVVQALAPNRQIGASLKMRLFDDRLSVQTGAFNGNGTTFEENENNQFLYVARLNWDQRFPVGGVQVGVNAAYSEDAQVNVPHIGLSNGERIVFGGDGEVVTEQWLVRIEFIGASFGRGSSVDAAYGYIGTLGYKLRGAHQFYVAYDVLDAGKGTNEAAVLSYKVYLNEILQVLANYRLPLDMSRGSEVVLRIQVAFR